MYSHFSGHFATRFAKYLVPLALAVGGFLWISYRDTVLARLSELQRSEEKYVALLSGSVTDDFQAILTDLQVLVTSRAVRQSVSDVPGGPPTVDMNDELAEELQLFAQQKKVYDQIRILDMDGMEKVRVNFQNDQASVVDAGSLQSKHDRYYFTATKNLPDGAVFVSPFDLNVEDGVIERPLKPTIRFGAPVVDLQGRRRGILVLNYLGQRMLDRFGRLDADSQGRAMLLNGQAYWLYVSPPNQPWGFMLTDRADQRFSAFFPQAWERIQSEPRGQLELADGLFTFETVQPFGVGSIDAGDKTLISSGRSTQRREWKVVSHISSGMLNDYLSAVRSTYLLLSLAMFTGVALSSGALAKLADARERSERALRASEARFRQMADAINEVFWLSGKKRRELQYVSPAFAAIWGEASEWGGTGRPFESAEEAGRRWYTSIHPDDLGAAKAVWEPQEGLDRFATEYRIRRSSGEWRWIRDQGFAVRDARGTLLGYAGIADDVTDMIESQRRLLQSERLAAIGEAITGIAHESRNALQRSQACLEMLGRRIADRPEAVELTERIQRALRDLHVLYQRVRDYAAPIQLQLVETDLRTVWQQTVDDLAATIERRKADIQELWPSVSSEPRFRAKVDPDSLRQVFRNVLENALDEELDRSAQRSQVRVEAEWSNEGDEREARVRLRIRDNGPGLQEGPGERIFEPFYTTKTRGTGLGMAISRRIIEAHGGSITARSEPGAGLEVDISLPVVR